MPWHRSIGSFVGAASWQTFGPTGSPARASLSLNFPRSAGRHGDERVFKVSSIRPRGIYGSIAPQPGRRNGSFGGSSSG